MSPKIKILPDHVVNKIAAGEVVERPSSVVKEMVENSIDAGATEIFVDIEQAGRRLIRVMDNGCGMSVDDARIAFQRHATSKITSDTDLESVRTMGFRGEALSSIASVAQVKLITAVPGAASGTTIEIEGGVVKTVADAAAPRGTSLEIAHLFYNTPARLKFLKSPGTEFSHIVTAVSRQAMANPSVRFRLTHNKKPVLDLPSSQGVLERAFQLYGNEIAENLIEFSGGRDQVQVSGLLARPGYSRADKTFQDFYVNRRAVRNASLSHALYGAFSDMLMRDRHPAAFIFVEIDPSLVDVNVHPAKAEVRFRNQSQIHDLVRDTIREGLEFSSAQNIPHRGSERTMPFYADRVTEAIADFGSGSADYKRSEYFAPQHGYDDSQLTFSNPYSEISIPKSELFPLCQIHDSFIIAQSYEGLAIIDQHAAHERVLFEKLQDQFQINGIPVQNLLMPLTMELGPAQAHLLAEYVSELEKFGFFVENFGGNTFIIKAIPALLVGVDYKKLLLDILDEVNVQGKSRKINELHGQILSVMACHPAIKVHRKLEMREMESLLSDLFKCRMPYTCPHGRPVILRFSINDMNKMFRRI